MQGLPLLKTQRLHASAGQHNSFPVQVGALCRVRGKHSKACQGEVEKVPRECFLQCRRGGKVEESLEGQFG